MIHPGQPRRSLLVFVEDRGELIGQSGEERVLDEEVRLNPFERPDGSSAGKRGSEPWKQPHAVQRIRTVPCKLQAFADLPPHYLVGVPIRSVADDGGREGDREFSGPEDVDHEEAPREEAGATGVGDDHDRLIGECPARE